jgi:hypothetical protein
MEDEVVDMLLLGLHSLMDAKRSSNTRPVVV